MLRNSRVSAALTLPSRFERKIPVGARRSCLVTPRVAALDAMVIAPRMMHQCGMWYLRGYPSFLIVTRLRMVILGICLHFTFIFLSRVLMSLEAPWGPWLSSAVWEFCVVGRVMAPQ